MSPRLPLTRITPSVTFLVDEKTGDVIAMSGGKEKARLLACELKNQEKLKAWKRKAWITDDFMLAVFRARDVIANKG
jgi:hypothetical protein